MSFWALFSQWQGGAVVAATLVSIPILSLLALSSQGKLNVTGWESQGLHGLYSRVKLFIKNNGQNNGNGKADLVAQIPLAELGNYPKYKWCIPDTSQLKKASTETQSAVSNPSTNDKCELKFFEKDSESSNSQVESGVIPYLLESITKWLEVQHVANMLLLYDKDVSLTNNRSNGITQKIKTACNISDSETFKVIKELFLGSSSWAKNCLMSPIILNLKLNLNNSTSTVSTASTSSSSNNLTKEKLSSSSMTGVINYGIFDYHSYKKLKPIPASGNGGGSKNYSLKINWEIPYQLKSETSGNEDKCSLDKLHSKTKNKELKMEDIKSCISSVS